MSPSPPGDARLSAAASAVPPHRVEARAAIEILSALFPAEDPAFVRRLVENSGVEQRFVVPPAEELLEPPSFRQRNATWRAAALELAGTASATALARAGLAAEEVDAVVDVSCTGIAIPALDVGLAPALGLRPDVRRIPITESGCAAGGVALSLAAPLARGGERVLVCAVELCSLTLGAGRRSRADLVSAVIFGDGAAAAVVRPDGTGPRIVATGSHLIPDTAGVMGFEVGEEGLGIVLARELPAVLTRHLPAALDDFLARHGRRRADVALHLVHPGGRRILDAYEELFDLAPEDLRLSRAALRDHGNLSSASILTVLEGALAEASLAEGDEALVVAVGPGLALEFLLLRGGPRA